MDFAAVLAQMNDLPPTFRRQGNPYAQLIAAKAAAFALFTNGADATMAQVTTFAGAIDGWIDLWGLLFGVQRNDSEGNIPYALRIAETVLAWVGTLPALQVWTALFAPGGSVTENIPGYTVALPPWMTPTQIVNFILSLNRIRPAGMPFKVTQNGRGLYLNSEGFLGIGTDFGTYLTGPLSLPDLNLNPTTCSSQPLIPTLYLTDPLLNPGLAGAA